jgi:hypothetical protein
VATPAIFSMRVSVPSDGSENSGPGGADNHGRGCEKFELNPNR